MILVNDLTFHIAKNSFKKDSIGNIFTQRNICLNKTFRSKILLSKFEHVTGYYYYAISIKKSLFCMNCGLFFAFILCRTYT